MTATVKEKEALEWAFEIVADELETTFGDMAALYGEDWPDIALDRAIKCRTIAQLVGPCDKSRWLDLAGGYEVEAIGYALQTPGALKGPYLGEPGLEIAEVPLG